MFFPECVCFGIKPWSQKHWVNFKPRPPCIPDRIWKYENWHQAEMFLSFLFLDLSNMFSFCVFFWVTHFQEFGDVFSKISINSLVEAMISWKSHHPDVFALQGSGEAEALGHGPRRMGDQKHRLPRKLATTWWYEKGLGERVLVLFLRNMAVWFNGPKKKASWEFFWWPTQRCN